MIIEHTVGGNINSALGWVNGIRTRDACATVRKRFRGVCRRGEKDLCTWRSDYRVKEVCGKKLFFVFLHGDITRDRPIKVSPKIRWRNMDPRMIFCSPVYPADRFDAVSVTLFGPAAAVQVSFDIFML